MISTTDPVNNTTWTVFDALNRPVKTVSALGRGLNDTHFTAVTVLDAVGMGLGGYQVATGNQVDMTGAATGRTLSSGDRAELAGQMTPGAILTVAGAAYSVNARLGSLPNEPVVFNEVPNAGATGQFSTLRPGPYAVESIPAPGPGQTITPAMHEQINAIGGQYGCHTCGTTSPGTPLGNFITDHQPPTAMTLPGQSQRLYPQCLPCSRSQGGQIRAWQQ